MNDSATASDDAQVVDAQTQGITESQATDSQSVEESESTASAVSEETLDAVALAKENAQIKMELNQKRNALAEIEKQKEADRQAELSEVERLREQLAKVEEEENQREAERLRGSFIEDYQGDARVKEAAKKLVAENPGNLSWGDVQSEDEAKAAIHRQMDALAAVLPQEPQEQEEGYTVHPNNPSARIGDRQLENLSAAEMRDVLPIADPR